jgi:hypothetical protein
MDAAAMQQRLDRARAQLPRAGRRALIALIILVALIVIIHVILDPLATHLTRKSLGQLDGYKGDFDRVHVTIFSPGYDITRLKLIETPHGSWKEPLFYADRIHVGVEWRRLLHGDLVAVLRIIEPKGIIVKAAGEPAANAPKTKEKAKEATRKAPDLSTQLQKITAMKVDRIEILRGEVLFRDMSQPRHPEFWLHRFDLAAENLATRPELARGRPSTVSGHGTLGRSGDVTLFVSADPFAQPLSFAGKFSLTGYRAAELFDLVEPKTELQTPKGTIDVFAEFVCRRGELTGGVKPVLKNIEVRPTESGIWDRLKAWAADKAVEIASDRVPGRNAIATVVPIKGRITDPEIQLWPAVLGVVRNAFVEGLTSGFSHVPPPTAEKKEGVVSQIKHALKKDEGPPKAQPQTQGRARARA